MGGGSKKKSKKQGIKRGCIGISKKICDEREAKGKGCKWNGSSCEFDCSYFTAKGDCTYKKRKDFCKWESDACIKKLVSTMFGAVDASECEEITDEYECNDVVKGAGGVTKQCEWEYGQCQHLSCEEKTDPWDCVDKAKCKWVQVEDVGKCAFWKRREMQEE